MMESVFVFLMMCGKVDTVIVKFPDKDPVYTQHITEETVKKLNEIITKDSTVIIYEDKRIKCI